MVFGESLENIFACFPIITSSSGGGTENTENVGGETDNVRINEGADSKISFIAETESGQSQWKKKF